MSVGYANQTLSWIFLEWRRLLSKALMPYGVTIQQFYILSLLNKKGSLVASQVAVLLHCDRPTASVIIQHLVKKDLILKVQRGQNKKYYDLELSAKGEQLIHSILEDVTLLKCTPYDTLNEEELHTLCLLLQKVKSQVEVLKGEQHEFN